MFAVGMRYQRQREAHAKQQRQLLGNSLPRESMRKRLSLQPEMLRQQQYTAITGLQPPDNALLLTGSCNSINRITLLSINHRSASHDERRRLSPSQTAAADVESKLLLKTYIKSTSTGRSSEPTATSSSQQKTSAPSKQYSSTILNALKISKLTSGAPKSQIRRRSTPHFKDKLSTHQQKSLGIIKEVNLNQTVQKTNTEEKNATSSSPMPRSVSDFITTATCSKKGGREQNSNSHDEIASENEKSDHSCKKSAKGYKKRMPVKSRSLGEAMAQSIRKRFAWLSFTRRHSTDSKIKQLQQQRRQTNNQKRRNTNSAPTATEEECSLDDHIEADFQHSTSIQKKYI